MQTKIIEAASKEGNWGKFMLARLDEEWQRRSVISERILLSEIGWTRKHLVVFDLQTGEGALFLPGGYARADLDKHKVWVCPLFEPFLEWLYTQNLSYLNLLPDSVEIPAPLELVGYRRKGE